MSRLREMAQQLNQEAHSLLVTLLFESAPPALADAADELLDRFCEVLQQVDAMIGQDQRTI